MTYIQNALELLAPTQKGFEIWRSADWAAAWNLEVKEKKTFLPGFSKRKVVSRDSLRKIPSFGSRSLKLLSTQNGRCKYNFFQYTYNNNLFKTAKKKLVIVFNAHFNFATILKIAERSWWRD